MKKKTLEILEIALEIFMKGWEKFEKAMYSETATLCALVFCVILTIIGAINYFLPVPIGSEIKSTYTPVREIGYTEEIIEETEEVKEESIYDKAENFYVNANILNVRDEEGNKIGEVKAGTMLVTFGQEYGMHKIFYNGQFAYVSSAYLTKENPLVRVESTAYYNPNGNKTADCSECVANLTLAGKREWLGKSCYLYTVNADGTLGECMGYYEFHDTGYGQESGEGTSNILKGKTLGTIEQGSCIDIYMDTYNECVEYGRQDVAILFTNEETF